MNSKVASDQITIVDDGTLLKKRGSLSIDDEGTPTQNTVLIENSILKNFMQDRLNARLMGKNRQEIGEERVFSSIPMPRMTNTYMINGNYHPDELIKSTKKVFMQPNLVVDKLILLQENLSLAHQKPMKLKMVK